MLITPSDTRIGSAEFGDYHYDRFLVWAFVDRQSKAALLRNLAVARTDANKDLIDDKLQYYCDLYNLGQAELLERIRQADLKGISIPQLHKLLSPQQNPTEEEV